MELFKLKIEAQYAILEHTEADEYSLKFDSVQYDAVEGCQFDVLGYNYNQEGVLEYVESCRFTY